VFIDTSVIVVILSKEPDATEFANQIEAAEGLTSALVILESAMNAWNQQNPRNKRCL